MNTLKLLQQGVANNMRLMGIKTQDVAPRLDGYTQQEIRQALTTWYGQQGVDPLEYTGLIDRHLQELGR